MGLFRKKSLGELKAEQNRAMARYAYYNERERIRAETRKLRQDEFNLRTAGIREKAKRAAEALRDQADRIQKSQKKQSNMWEPSGKYNFGGRK